MQSTESRVSLPPVRLVEGRDDDLIEWFASLRQNNMIVSVCIRQAIRGYLKMETARDERLDRIERLLLGLNQSPGSVRQDDKFNDPILDGGL